MVLGVRMVGWRRAFCTSVPSDDQSCTRRHRTPHISSPSDNNNVAAGRTGATRSPRFGGAKFSFFSATSNPPAPVTPRLTVEAAAASPKLRCRTTAAEADRVAVAVAASKTKCPPLFSRSNPASPRSPSAFALLKSTFARTSKSVCGICLQSVKAGQGTAIFTAECSHAFHFPCVAKLPELVCPTCGTIWNEIPLLSIPMKPPRPSSIPDPHNHNSSQCSKSPPPTAKGYELKVYDDDEPLSSPTSGARFNPIPESDENDNDDDEFQGFFIPAVLPNKPSNVVHPIAMFSPDVAIVSSGKTSETYAALLKLRTPPPETSVLNAPRRAPIDLVAVADVAAAELQALKRAMRLVISSLSSTDRLSIVAFSATSKRLLPLRRMTSAGRRVARRVVDGLVPVRGGGFAGDALKKAAKVLDDRRERNSAASIFLISDARSDPDRAGNATPAVLLLSARSSHQEIPVHVLGLGDGGAWEEAFAERVNGLLRVAFHDVGVHIRVAPGSAPSEIPAVYSTTGRGPTGFGPGSIRIGDLRADEEREVLVELKAPTTPASGTQHVLSVRCSHRDPFSHEVHYGAEQALVVPRPRAVRSSGPGIERLRNVFVSTRAVAESRRLVERAEFTAAHHLLSSARALLQQSTGPAGAEEFVRSLEAELAELNRRRHRLRPARLGRVAEEQLTPTSAWRAAEKLAKVAVMRKSLNRVSDLHGFENARF